MDAPDGGASLLTVTAADNVPQPARYMRRLAETYATDLIDPATLTITADRAFVRSRSEQAVCLIYAAMVVMQVSYKRCTPPFRMKNGTWTARVFWRQRAEESPDATL